MTKRQHGAKVKANIAIEAIKGEKMIAEIVKHNNVHLSRIHGWKAEALKGLEGIFNNHQFFIVFLKISGMFTWCSGV